MDEKSLIPSKRNRKIALPRDAAVYRHQTCSECCSSRMKHFRRFATRYARRAIQFSGFRHLAAAIIWLI